MGGSGGWGGGVVSDLQSINMTKFCTDTNSDLIFTNYYDV